MSWQDWDNDRLRVDVADTQQDTQRLRIDDNDIRHDDQLYMRVEPNDYHNKSVMIHLSSFVAIWLGGLAVLGPLILWLIMKDDSPEIEPHAKEAINFHITTFIQAVIVFVLFISVIGWAILIPLIPYLIILCLISIICPIIAAFKASNGELYRYPLTIRFLK